METIIKWKRKPSTNIEWKDFRNEDLFFCHTCKKYYPSSYYDKGLYIIFRDENINPYKYLIDEEDRGGRQWSCNICIYDNLYKNKLITIRNIDGKIIK